MPTKLPRTSHFPDNLSANLEVKDTCPAVWTGQKLFDKRPADYARCVQMLTAGATIKQVAKACKISANTVAVVRTREAEVQGIEETPQGIDRYGQRNGRRADDREVGER